MTEDKGNYRGKTGCVSLAWEGRTVRTKEKEVLAIEDILGPMSSMFCRGKPLQFH